MKGKRDNVLSGDWLVAQIFDKASFRRLYGVAGMPVKWAARYAQVVVNGFPRFQHVANTGGPIGGFLCMFGLGDRKQAQWALGGVPCQITSVGPPIQATPIHDAIGGVATKETTLKPFNVTMIDGSTPSVNDFVIVVAGTDLTDQQAIAFKGGGGGGGMTAFQIDSGTNPYNAHQIDLAADPTGNTPKSGGISTAALYEMNSSSILKPLTNVYAQLEGSNWMVVLPMKTCT